MGMEAISLVGLKRSITEAALNSKGVAPASWAVVSSSRSKTAGLESIENGSHLRDVRAAAETGIGKVSCSKSERQSGCSGISRIPGIGRSMEGLFDCATGSRTEEFKPWL